MNKKQFENTTASRYKPLAGRLSNEMKETKARNETRNSIDDDDDDYDASSKNKRTTTSSDSFCIY